jgi:DNA-directed RNA polymerase alpha subunit
VNGGVADPGSFPKLTRLAIRQFLAEHEIGAEVVLSVSKGQPTLSLATEVKIVELELSQRSYNCLRDASIRTLDDLLTWSSEQLSELPNFGRKSLTEIIGVLRQLGYPNFCREPEDESIEQTPRISLQPGDLAGSLKMRVSELGLSVRSGNCLQAASINTLGQLLARTPEQLLRLPNFGQKCMSEIREVIQRLGCEDMLGQELLSPDEPVAEETTSIIAQKQAERKRTVGDRGSAPLACLLLLRELPIA